LKLQGLLKTYGSKTVVNGINLQMFNGEIFALLGHNGAGKTTTISMLTGLTEPSDGAAEVFGVSVFDNMNEIRQMLGVCP
jgi:ATP-binding cassette subfamily A (ABC1) protein 3